MGLGSALSVRISSWTYRPLYRKWPRLARKANIWLMAAELVGLIPTLTIFALSQPNLYRTAMWQIGWDNHLNSDPAVILYAFANHVPQPRLPLIWSQGFTDYNVAISVVSLFFLLAKLIAVIMKLWYPIMSTITGLTLLTLYTVSVYGQVGRDHLDPRFPAPAAWYFRFGCDLAKPTGQYQNCQIAQASLFIALYMQVVYLLALGFSIYAMWPNPINDVADDDDDAKMNPKPRGMEMEDMWTPTISGAGPFTPRTHAFHSLDRKLPLRGE